MLEAQITQQATSSSTFPGRLPSKPKPNPYEQCNCVILRGELEGFEGVRFEKGGEVTKAMSDEQSDKLEAITFEERSSLEVPEEFPPKLEDLGSFSIPYKVGNMSVARALCDLGSSVSLISGLIF